MFSSNKKCDICSRVGAIFCSALSKNLCCKHYRQYQQYKYIKDDNPRTINDPNNIYVIENEAYIDIYNQKNEHTYTAIIDANMVDKVRPKKWRCSIKKSKPYIITGHGAGSQIYLARFILDYDGDMEVDHIDGNTLNNKIENLRIVPHVDNVKNTKAKCTNVFGVRGISKGNQKKSYTVDFSFQKERYYMKPWHTLAEAVACRYFLEIYINPKYRYSTNDENIQYYLNMLPENKLKEIEQYVLTKIKEHTDAS